MYNRDSESIRTEIPYRYDLKMSGSAARGARGFGSSALPEQVPGLVDEVARESCGAMVFAAIITQSS